MTMRKTPNLRLRYPWTDDVVSAVDLDSMAQDIDQELVRTATLAATFSRFASVSVSRSTVQSITKATLTAITFNTVGLDNGANSPLSNGAWWAAGSPTRLTAPVPCVVLASGFGGMNLGSALGTNGAVQVTITLNGAAAAPGVQGTKWGPVSTVTGQQWASALSMWKLAAGDFLELKMYWTGTPAGPFNTDNVLPPRLSLMMVALPSVP
jgi:hypothetical protein